MEDFLIDELVSSAPAIAGRQQTKAIRDLITDMDAGRIRFNLPFQRKQVWKQEQEIMWIIALFKGVMPDPISISKRGVDNRGINGGNRCRSINKFVKNQFPIELKHDNHKYCVWFSRIPDEFAAAGRRSRTIHICLSSLKREQFLAKEIHINLREGLTDSQELNWYREMNKNNVRHSEGQLLLTQLCVGEEFFATSLLDLFPVLKPRIQMSREDDIENNLYDFFAEKFELELNSNDPHDINEDIPVAIARIHNLLINGSPYHYGFKGKEITEEQLEINAQTFRDIFEGWTPSADLKLELSEAASSKKKCLPNAYSPSYLLGPIAWSIGANKPNVVDTWKKFLQRCEKGTIERVYVSDNNSSHVPDSSATKYSNAWDAVVREVS
jgi:hypothetical protein